MRTISAKLKKFEKPEVMQALISRLTIEDDCILVQYLNL